jgi:hypothetical protein
MKGRLLAALAISMVAAGPAMAQYIPPDPRAVPPLPPIGLPLPTIGLPLPPTGLPVPSSNQQPRRNAPPRRGNHRGPQVAPIYVFPTYVVTTEREKAPTPECVGSGCDATGTAVRSRGRFHVDIQPRNVAQVYLDGVFIGTAGESWEDLDVDAGPHLVEVRADGFEPAQESVLVTSGRALTYTTTLQRIAPPAVTPPTGPAAPAAYYFIRGCYVGNVPPEQADLPAGCDAKKAVKVER